MLTLFVGYVLQTKFLDENDVSCFDGCTCCSNIKITTVFTTSPSFSTVREDFVDRIIAYRVSGKSQ